MAPLSLWQRRSRLFAAEETTGGAGSFDAPDEPAPPLPRTNRVGRSDRAPRDLASVVLAHSAALVEALGLTFRRKARAEADSHVGALWNADERRSVLSVRRTPSRRRGRWQQ